MGFDDIYLAALVEPSLTTVRQPNYDMGYKAMELLLENINNKNNSQSSMENITLKTEIIERNSI